MRGCPASFSASATAAAGAFPRAVDKATPDSEAQPPCCLRECLLPPHCGHSSESCQNRRASNVSNNAAGSEEQMTFSGGLKLAYRGSWDFFSRAWWLVILLGFPEFLTLVVPVVPKALGWPVWQLHGLQYAVSLAAALLELAVFYTFMRFLAFAGDLRSALNLNRGSARTFGSFTLAYLAFSALATAMRFELDANAWWLPIEVILALLFAPWAVSAPGGGKVVGPLAAVRAGISNLIWSTAFLLTALLPIIVATALMFAVAWLTLESEWAGWLYHGVDLALTCAQNLIFYAALYVIALHAGLRIATITEERQPAPT